ncbi:DUF262 domain-containing protein [Tistrella mobilis]|uniref:DUF262 domain-containing protein n=1 Tax=Tistrella mobilis TaxID=171437 RepID=UPI0009EE4361|nr:DUF262 domain-containing protein [Tistrella mobilis]
MNSDLKSQVDVGRKEIRTDDYAISIGEWISMYEGNEIDIHPEFQRFFRWSSAQKSALIESILLGIPLPPIFVSQRPDGVWDVIDGLQRLSTIFELVGVLRDEQGDMIPQLELERTEYLPALHGYTWHKKNEDDGCFLSNELRLIIKRSKINVSIILKESDDKTKYDLFQRLNTGGSQLSAQEVRNCIMVMINREFYLWIKSLSEVPSFRETTAISERLLSEAYDIELVLRFLIISDAPISDLSNIGDLGVYIKEKMIQMAKDEKLDKDALQKKFVWTFDTLARELGENSFKRYNRTKGRHEGAFLVSQSPSGRLLNPVNPL